MTKTVMRRRLLSQLAKEARSAWVVLTMKEPG